MTDSERHRNDERTVECPVCGVEKLARGMHLHILRSSGDGHGPQNEVPDHIDLDDLETVGEQEVTMEYPTERNNESATRLCPYCGKPFSGTEGVIIHLGQVAGRHNHPKDAAEGNEASDFPRVEVDEKGNIVRVLDEEPPVESRDLETGRVDGQYVYHLIAELLANGSIKEAELVRRRLLIPNIEPIATPDLPAVQVLDRIVEATADRPRTVTCGIQSGKVYIGCRGQSAELSAEEAQELADYFHAITSEGLRSEDFRPLADYLHECAAVVGGADSEEVLVAKRLEIRTVD